MSFDSGFFEFFSRAFAADAAAIGAVVAGVGVMIRLGKVDCGFWIRSYEGNEGF